MIDIYVMNTEPLIDDSLYALAYSRLSAERRARADRMRQTADKIRSVGASLVLEYALGRLGITDPHYSYGKRGKPFLSNRDDVHFNLSHSGDRVMCAISAYPVGCDVERESIGEVSVKMEDLVLSKSERQLCSEAFDRKRTFFRLWTSKESFVKVLGEGMAINLSETEIAHFDGETGKSLVVSSACGGKKYYVREYFFDDGYCYACCSADDEFPRKPHILKIENILEDR